MFWHKDLHRIALRIQADASERSQYFIARQIFHRCVSPRTPCLTFTHCPPTQASVSRTALSLTLLGAEIMTVMTQAPVVTTTPTKKSAGVPQLGNPESNSQTTDRSDAGGDAWGRMGGRKWGGGDEQLVQIPFVLKPGVWLLKGKCLGLRVGENSRFQQLWLWYTRM